MTLLFIVSVLLLATVILVILYYKRIIKRFEENEELFIKLMEHLNLEIEEYSFGGDTRIELNIAGKINRRKEESYKQKEFERLAKLEEFLGIEYHHEPAKVEYRKRKSNK